ncbi:MAG: hypothetical protein O0W85_04100 [Methanocorpusculum sp.]|uniref:Uncharacterized protein n=2 Tax=Methanocorpusculum vombati TaxID=3002864 RepID=A0ABT4IIV7_9EURY|nr:hypothetical protein [Methanocorpusculum vombati]MDE2547846.1 hypothetical protein [Methanocorpusculum sp.]
MQAMDQRPQKTSITVSAHIKERVCSKKRGNQTYDDVLEQMLDVLDIGETGEEGGVVFLHTVYVHDELKKLKRPMPLKITIQEDESLILTNDEYSFLITCRTLSEGLEKARLMFADDYDIFTDPDTPMYPSAAAYGKLLKDSVWM